MTIDLRMVLPTLLDLPLDGREPVDHFVEFYDDDRAMIDSVRTFVSRGLGLGEATVLVTTAAHREAIEAELARVVDLAKAREQGRFMSLDADEMLALFMDDGLPDPLEFFRLFGDVIERASEGGRRVRVFGEMVAVLAERGNLDAAFSLEDLWNRLTEMHAFRLFCAYPTETFGDDDLTVVAGLCHRHSHVVAPTATAV